MEKLLQPTSSCGVKTATRTIFHLDPQRNHVKHVWDEFREPWVQPAIGSAAVNHAASKSPQSSGGGFLGLWGSSEKPETKPVHDTDDGDVVCIKKVNVFDQPRSAVKNSATTVLLFSGSPSRQPDCMHIQMCSQTDPTEMLSRMVGKEVSLMQTADIAGIAGRPSAGRRIQGIVRSMAKLDDIHTVTLDVAFEDSRTAQATFKVGPNHYNVFKMVQLEEPRESQICRSLSDAPHIHTWHSYMVNRTDPTRKLYRFSLEYDLPPGSLECSFRYRIVLLPKSTNSASSSQQQHKNREMAREEDVAIVSLDAFIANATETTFAPGSIIHVDGVKVTCHTQIPEYTTTCVPVLSGIQLPCVAKRFAVFVRHRDPVPAPGNVGQYFYLPALHAHRLFIDDKFLVGAPVVVVDERSRLDSCYRGNLQERSFSPNQEDNDIRVYLDEVPRLIGVLTQTVNIPHLSRIDHTLTFSSIYSSSISFTVFVQCDIGKSLITNDPSVIFTRINPHHHLWENAMSQDSWLYMGFVTVDRKGFRLVISEIQLPLQQ